MARFISIDSCLFIYCYFTAGLSKLLDKDLEKNMFLLMAAVFGSSSLISGILTSNKESATETLLRNEGCREISLWLLMIEVNLVVLGSAGLL